MTVYIELAFLENFCLDFLLLALVAYAVRAATSFWRLFISAAVGGGFAILFPLITLPAFFKIGLKLSVGALLPWLAIGKEKWGRGLLWFFLFTFAFGGALTGAQNLHKWARFPLFFGLAGLSLLLVERLYKKRAVWQYLYDCEVKIGEKQIRTRGFLDSGNFAAKGGLPVCFVSADILYALLGDNWLLEGKGRGQGCVEMQITTQAGAKKTPLYRGVIRLNGWERVCEKEVYFALLKNKIGKEYSVLLNSRILEE